MATVSISDRYRVEPFGGAWMVADSRGGDPSTPVLFHKRSAQKVCRQKNIHETLRLYRESKKEVEK